MKQYGAKIRETGVRLMSPEACGTPPEYTDPIINDAGAFAQTDIIAGHLYQGFTDLDNGYVKIVTITSAVSTLASMERPGG